ncbi:hypothetical protein CKO28_04660 [Rhodovibrio sodomensis]|uniref:histidine kinase n=1 Tax=Rhodovibrio sodomensis TaxID=1088 RepID=A0ABS1DAS1_9PROT|nr:PAS domain S-box protein [Rhodovibrio sodomensis]MBK1667319.1 hypothetical protein [Rhodovibrio sodomensis]
MVTMSYPAGVLDTQQYAAFFEKSPNAVLITAPEMDGEQQRIHYVNPAFERMTGWSIEDVRGLTPAILQGPETDRGIFPALRVALERGEAWEGETVNYRRDGSPFRMAWSISPILGADGGIVAFLAIQEDVTEHRRMERALAKSEQRYRAIFEQSFQLIGVVDPGGTLLEANETALRFADVTESEVLGLPFWETPWWEACEASRTRLREAVADAANGTLVQFLGRCRGRKGAVHEVEVSIKPVVDQSGRVIMLIPEGRDITQLAEQRRRLRRETARLRNAQRIGRMGGWDYDIATASFHNQPETMELFGLPHEVSAMSRAELEAIIHPEDIPHQRAGFDRACATGARYDVSFRIATPAGEYVVNAVGEPVCDSSGRITGLVGIVQDVTERDRVQRELEAARKAAVAASEAKSRFLATMGHELRTPLNAINGFSELLAREAFGPLGHSSYRDYSAHIHDSGRHLLDLINSILDATRLEVGQFEVAAEPFELAPVVRSAVEQMQPAATAAGIELAHQCPSDMLLTADQRLLRQVLFNLIGNAIKFSPTGTAVEVNGHTDAEGRCVLRVSDAGPGIPEKDRARVLKPFQQIDDRLSRRHEGVGLGLYIVQQIVEAHGATMEIGTSAAGGAEMTIVFPSDTGPFAAEVRT